jgi:DnaJ-class molecular chaperone
MEKSKKYNSRLIICPNCRGNGYIRLTLGEGREQAVAQCPDCESKGEIYVDESEVVESYIDADDPADHDYKLH